MAKNDHAHAVRLVESIQKNIGTDAATALEERFPLSKSATLEKKYEWAKNSCTYLEEHYDTETIIKLRKDCRCNDGNSIAAKLSKYLHKAENIKAFVNAINQQETFAAMEYISDHQLLFCYPQCYCACIKRAAGGVSKTWCYCTLGNAESIFRQVFPGENVKVTLIESIKTGGERCVIKVEW